MTLTDIMAILQSLISDLERTGDGVAAAYVAQAKLDLGRARALLEPGEPAREIRALEEAGR